MLDKTNYNDTTVQMDLPDTLSGLILVALDDLERVEKDPRYVVEMREWHKPTQHGCQVCLAGAVMTRSLHPDQSYPDFTFDEFDEKTRDKFSAINMVREGMFASALCFIGAATNLAEARLLLSKAGLSNDVPVAEYSVTPKLFKDQLRVNADALEKVGL